MSFSASKRYSAGPDGPGGRIRDRMRRGTGTRFGARAATSGALAALCILGLASPAGASAGPAGPAAGRSTRPAQVLRLRAMPAGTVTFGRQHGRLTVHAVMFGLTPGLSHSVT